MSIDKRVKSIVVFIAGAGTALGMLAGINFYEHHNVSYETDNQRVFQKADGILGYTEVRIDEDGSVKMNRFSWGNNRGYTDKDANGVVDETFGSIPNQFSRGSHFGYLKRNEHLRQYAAVFQEADGDFRQQVQRFKPHLHWRFQSK